MTTMGTFATISHVINMVKMLPTDLITMVATGYHGYSILVVALVSFPVHKLRVSHVAVAGCRSVQVLVYVLVASGGKTFIPKFVEIPFESSSVTCTTYRERVRCCFNTALNWL
jgi:hypothetical protein